MDDAGLKRLRVYRSNACYPYSPLVQRIDVTENYFATPSLMFRNSLLTPNGVEVQVPGEGLEMDYRYKLRKYGFFPLLTILHDKL